MTSLRCYTCNTTHVDRFSKEVTYSNACAERWSMMMVMVKTINIVTIIKMPFHALKVKTIPILIRNSTGPIVECEDPREYCVFDNDHPQVAIFTIIVMIIITTYAIHIASTLQHYNHEPFSPFQDFRKPGCAIPKGEYTLYRAFEIWLANPSSS